MLGLVDHGLIGELRHPRIFQEPGSTSKLQAKTEDEVEVVEAARMTLEVAPSH